MGTDLEFAAPKQVCGGWLTVSVASSALKIGLTLIPKSRLAKPTSEPSRSRMRY